MLFTSSFLPVCLPAIPALCLRGRGMVEACHFLLFLFGEQRQIGQLAPSMPWPNAVIAALRVLQQPLKRLPEGVVILPVREVADMPCAAPARSPGLVGLYYAVVHANGKQR